MAGRKENALYTSKADLIQWAGDLLQLRLSRLEQFASGAIYCQLLDAYFQNVINLQKVNFHAREEYEFLPNYKQLQAALARLRVQRSIDVSKLSRAAPVDNLDFLQWTYKYLRGKNMQADYDPAERRMHSSKGGIDSVPLPIWLSNSFDVYGGKGAGGSSPADGQGNARSRQVSRTPSARTSATSVAGSVGSVSQKARPARSSVRTMPLTPTAEDRAMPQAPPPSGPATSARSARRSTTPSRATPSRRATSSSSITTSAHQTPVPPTRATSFTRLHQQNGTTPRTSSTAASRATAAATASATRSTPSTSSARAARTTGSDPPNSSRSHRTYTATAATTPAATTPTATSTSASVEHPPAPEDAPEPSTPRALSPPPDAPDLPVSSGSENGVNGNDEAPSAAVVSGPLAPTPAPISTPVQVPRIPAADTRQDPGSPNSEAALSPGSKDGISDAVDVLGQAVSLLQRTTPNLGRLAPALGTANDSYAFRGKMRSLQDATSTLAQHCWRLLRDLQELSSRRSTAGHPRLAAAGLAPLVQELQACDSMLAGVRSTVAAAEAEVGPPKPNPPRLADQHRELSSTKHLDAMLRTLGSAHAAMLQRCHREAAAITARFLDMAQPSSPTSSQASGPVAAGENGERTFTTTKVLKLGEYQMKRLKNGDIYKGRYVSNRKNGEGVYSFINADVYEGQFKDDRMEGHGVYTFSHEGRYEGQWSHAVYEGSGAETFAKGSTYQGQYTLGLRHGWGACRFYSGDYYEGHWFRGLRDGRGMQQCTDDSNYVGDYHKGKRHGFGVYSFPNGDRYVGEYQEDIPHGHGVYLFATGQSYEGQWVSGRKHGWSIYTVETGERWAGQWKEGKPLWVQPLPPADAPGDDTNKDDTAEGGVQSNLNLSWDACRSAQQAAQQAAARADDHWKSDGEIQRGIQASLQLAGAAAEEAQRMRASARELAARLDSAAALVEDRKQAPGS